MIISKRKEEEEKKKKKNIDPTSEEMTRLHRTGAVELMVVLQQTSAISTRIDRSLPFCLMPTVDHSRTHHTGIFIDTFPPRRLTALNYELTFHNHSILRLRSNRLGFRSRVS
ncbi:hypothetical protein CEXT_710491 [Caerostris extrusa]|uniref:Uncharacterized protein n=1 Tax=Caerostris extrusa TaxID=172846 RepID=A0AAV4SDA9_CAEEX|nr:hypothetical protein CEXT_710491 [Caerostris extrusa]